MGVHAQQQVTGRGQLAVRRVVERGLPGLRHLRRVAGGPGVVGVEVVLREHRVLVVDPRCVLEIARLVAGPLVGLGGAQVGQREHRVVVATWPQQIEPAPHLPDRDVHAVGAAGHAVVATVRVVGIGQGRQQVRPVDEDRIVGPRRVLPAGQPRKRGEDEQDTDQHAGTASDEHGDSSGDGRLFRHP